MTDYLDRLPEVIEWLDSLKEHAKLVGYKVGSTVEAERIGLIDISLICAYCDDNDLAVESDATCGAALCENEYWNELNAETLRGG